MGDASCCGSSSPSRSPAFDRMRGARHTAYRCRKTSLARWRRTVVAFRVKRCAEGAQAGADRGIAARRADIDSHYAAPPSGQVSQCFPDTLVAGHLNAAPIQCSCAGRPTTPGAFPHRPSGSAEVTGLLSHRTDRRLNHTRGRLGVTVTTLSGTPGAPNHDGVDHIRTADGSPWWRRRGLRRGHPRARHRQPACGQGWRRWAGGLGAVGPRRAVCHPMVFAPPIGPFV